MPSGLSSDAVALLTFLMPGFIAAWVFYGLTSHSKPAQFERVIQALILTFVIYALVLAVQHALQLASSLLVLGQWTSQSHTFTSVILSLLLGVCLAYAVNKDSLHGWLRTKGFTSKTAHPSEWYCVLSQKPTFVILNLVDGRRLYGWPKEWPIERDRGQFYIEIPSWIDDEKGEVPLPELDGILIDAKDVQWVEFTILPKKENPNEQSDQGIQPAGAEAGDDQGERQSTA